MEDSDQILSVVVVIMMLTAFPDTLNFSRDSSTCQFCAFTKYLKTHRNIATEVFFRYLALSEYYSGQKGLFMPQVFVTVFCSGFLQSSKKLVRFSPCEMSSKMKIAKFTKIISSKSVQVAEIEIKKTYCKTLMYSKHFSTNSQNPRKKIQRS